MYYADDVVKKLKKSGQIAIFGAGIMAREVVACLQEELYQIHIECCMVSDLKGNPENVLGIPVLDFAGAEPILHKDTLILIAAVDKHLVSMQESLSQHGYFNVISLTYEKDLWSLIRGNVYRESRLKQGQPYLTLEEELQTSVLPSITEAQKKTAGIYSVRCHVDRKIQEDMAQYSWEIPIQAGAALTEERICRLCDNCGENISHKNRQYCELTALYWIWKNDTSDYVGLGHYRRHFEITENLLEKLKVSDIDVVLTIPAYVFDGVGNVYRRDHIWEDWLIMMGAIRKLFPEYTQAAKELEAGKFYYAYNMFIMRREILEDYCAWLFPILFYCEEQCAGNRDAYQGRHIGFLAERLMSIYFLYHEREYKIVHARKHFVEK